MGRRGTGCTCLRPRNVPASRKCRCQPLSPPATTPDCRTCQLPCARNQWWAGWSAAAIVILAIADQPRCPSRFVSGAPSWDSGRRGPGPCCRYVHKCGLLGVGFSTMPFSVSLDLASKGQGPRGPHYEISRFLPSRPPDPSLRFRQSKEIADIGDDH
jgi:hypothetical protein